MYVDRHSEIVNAVNEARRITANWLKSLQRGDALSLPPLVVAALRNMVIACEGDVPMECRDVHLAVQRVGLELNQYVHQYDGKVNPNGSPVSAFWAAIAYLESIADRAEVSHVSQLESVKELKTQKVSNDQIAFSIYGYRGKGPFVTSGGLVNSRLIDIAAESLEKQDQILKDSGWPSNDGVFFPPWMMPSNTAKKQESIDRLKAYKILEEGPKRYEDPDTIEDMLAAGCYVQQIERGKHVDRNTVLEIAAKLGIKPVDQPGWRPTTPQRDLPQPEVPQTQIPPQQFEPDPIKPSLNDQPDDHTWMAIESCAIANPSFGSPEIVAALGEDGIKTGSRQVTKVLNAIKKNQAKA